MMTSNALPRPNSLRPVATVAALTAAATVALWLGSDLLERPAGAASGPLPGHDIALAVHVSATLAALPLGGHVLWARKGGARHRTLGRIWAALMMIAALSSFWLRDLSGGLSLIHLLSLLTLVSIPLGVWYARRGAIQAHLRTMRAVYIGLVVAGLFAVVPGRLLGTMLFG
jgi:uncharacterized membrane protein